MVLFSNPVVGEDGCEHGGEYKVESFQVEGEEWSDESSYRGTYHPVGFVEPCDAKQIPSSIYSFWNLGGTCEGEGLVGHSEDEEELLPSQSLVSVEHGQSIEEVSGIDHQHHEESLDGMETPQQHVAQQKFRTAGIYRYRQEHGI